MWQTISDIIKSQPLIAILIIVIIVGLIFSGRLKITTSVLRVGHSDGERERNILDRQLKWLHTYCSSRVGNLQAFAARHNVDFEGQDPHGIMAKYICERVYDVCIQWAVLNHVREDEDYVKLKQDEIFELVTMLQPHPIYLTEEFRTELGRWTKEVIHRLITIRSTYEKGV